MLQPLRYLLLTLLLNSALAFAEPRILSFGIVPQQAPSKLAALWGPMLQEVSKASGVELQFATAPSIPEFEARLAKGEYDFAYMNPYHFTVFNQSPGYTALAKAKDKTIKGILVVRKDSPINDLYALQGAPIAFPAPAAFAATLLPQAHLNNANIGFSAKYVSSHDSVYLAVAKGLYPAGGGIERTLNNVDASLREQLRIVWTSAGYTPHAIAAHPRVASTDVQRVQQALLKLSDQPAGLELLKGLNIKGWSSAQDQDWDDVRQLNIKQLEH